MNFHLPNTKTKEKGDEVNVTDSTCPCSATTALEHHLSSNVAIPLSAPYSCSRWLMDSVAYAVLMVPILLQCCVRKDGLSSIKGHGFQIGVWLTTFAGCRPMVIMVQGAGAHNLFLHIGIVVRGSVSLHWFFFSIAWLNVVYNEHFQSQTHWLIEFLVSLHGN